MESTYCRCFDDVIDETNFHTDPEMNLEAVMSVCAKEVGAPPP